MKRSWLLAALALPIVGLLAGIAVNQAQVRDADTWRLPIEGYDPRDLLRGHYINFRYAWRTAGDPRLCSRRSCTLCLEKGDGGVVARFAAADSECSAKVDVVASNIDISQGFARQRSQFSSRIFVSEVSAPRMEKMLQEQPVELVALLTPEGRLVPQTIEPAR
ncbi:MAG: GDYXXLXY domain-containing protein [Sphingomonadaceae bacterium]